MAALLDRLTDEQQQFVEVVGAAFRFRKAWEWPVFEYVEATLEDVGIEARETFNSFPRVNPLGGTYAAVWSTGGPVDWPHPEHVISLTLVGIHHCRALGNVYPGHPSERLDFVAAFADLIKILLAKRRSVPPDPKAPRRIEITSAEVLGELATRRHRFDQMPEHVLYELLDHEPPFRGAGGTLFPDGSWSRGIPRELRDFADITTIDDYVALLEREPPPPPLAAPSPLGLVAAIDYLDTAWQVAHDRKHLFRLDSAERVAKLTYPANTSEELDSRLSELGEILNSMLAAVPGGKNRRGRPLGRLETHLTKLLGGAAAPRIARSVRTLEHVILVRDAGQHARARPAAVGALVDLGVGPTISPTAAWETIQSRTIEALGAVREELQAHVNRSP